MKWTGLNELRERYLKFFESKEHLALKSFSLVPHEDKSLLLINSGMAPMKKYFTGEITPPEKRVTTCQKCIRTPDIERVGITARHGTFFEMLGNFSFGDYFKREAINWAWEFFTKELSIPKELLYCSVYEEDDEAYDIWTKEMNVPEAHVVRMGKEDNFWEHGAGPCGPSSEIYFDRGEKYGCDNPDCTVGCECDRYVEVWNLVFTQFESDGKGTYTPLKNPNIDTGMGLERLACVMQGADNLFLVDTIQNTMKKVSEISKISYGISEKTDISLRVITDHIRSTTFMIGDGIMPSNEGRGYVLRRLLRRAARHGKLLGIQNPFLSDVCDVVISENKNSYPELEDKKETIKKIISFEEESFYKTIDQGLSVLNAFMEKATTAIFSGDDAFKLNDTYGFPLDLTREILAEKGIVIDEERFHALLFEQRERARNARKNAGADAWIAEGISLENLGQTVFTGYETLLCDSKIKLIANFEKELEVASEGDEVIIVAEKTPFYAESGGQCGDVGTITTETGSADIIDTTKNASGVYLHKAVVTNGEIKKSQEAKLEVNIVRRHSIERNHTAAHLLHATLKNILGTHVEQAGQLVDDKKLRFDFTHFEGLTQEQLHAVELMVNTEIMKALPVECSEMPIEEAKKLGATALFGEKYGDTVRVVSSGEISKEFCGGTHVKNTSMVVLFKIVSESSAAAGIRRIEAVTGLGFIKMTSELHRAFKESSSLLKIANPSQLPQKIAALISENKEKQKTIDSLNEKIASQGTKQILNNAVEVKGVNVVAVMISGADSKALKTMCDKVKDLSNDMALVAVFAGVSDGKGTIVSACSKLAVQKGLKAGEIVKEVAMITGGNGGGKPDFAMAGAKDINKIDEAINAVNSIVENKIKE